MVRALPPSLTARVVAYPPDQSLARVRRTVATHLESRRRGMLVIPGVLSRIVMEVDIGEGVR